MRVRPSGRNSLSRRRFLGSLQEGIDARSSALQTKSLYLVTVVYVYVYVYIYIYIIIIIIIIIITLSTEVSERSNA